MLSPLEQFNIVNLFSLNNFFFINTFCFSIFLFSLKEWFSSPLVIGLSKSSNSLPMVLWKILLNFFYNIFSVELGSKQKFFNFFLATFLILFFFNLAGMIGFGFTYTSHISVTLSLASMIFFGNVFFGFYLHGMSFLNVLKPSGAPKPLLPFLIVIEFLSFVSRVLSLSIRLFANMMSGHTLLFIIGSFCLYLHESLGSFYATPFWLVLFVLLFLELFIAALQAYVFTILSIIYLKDSYAGGH